MSTYINPNKEIKLEYDDCPALLDRYTKYMVAILNRAKRTVNSYVIDILLFLRFYSRLSGKVSSETKLEDIRAKDLSDDEICSVTDNDIHAFVYYLADDRQNSPSTRKHKLTSLLSFYQYIVRVEKKIDKNPVSDIVGPSLKGLSSRQPKFLVVEQEEALLTSVDGEFPERDYCMLVLFLNCGMRLSELTAINLENISQKTILITGKGNKQRTVYMNQMCLDALADYRMIRDNLPNLIDENALFISKRNGQRITNRQVERIVKKCMEKAGLSYTGCTPHSLRHTAATMYYRAGADLPSLAAILGHSSTKVTEIYTHINEESIAEIVNNSPLVTDKS